MPFGGLLSLGSAAIGIGSSLGGLFGGTPSQNVQSPQGYQFQNTGGADNAAYNNIPGMSGYNVAGTSLPQFQGIAQNVVNNPYAQSYVGNAANTGQAGVNAGGQLASGALGMLPDVSALTSLGFDPQNALYSKLQNQNQQQNAAILGNSGVAGTPYGAGVAADANSNFNINWQNQQLQRATQGAGAAGSLLGQIGGATGTGLNQMAAGGAMPYNAYGGTQTDALSALSQAGQFGQTAAAIPQQQIQDYLAYLGSATGQQNANTNLFGQQLNQANQTFNQQQTLGKNLGSGLAGLGSALGKTGWGGSFGGGGGTGTGFSLGGTGGLY